MNIHWKHASYYTSSGVYEGFTRVGHMIGHPWKVPRPMVGRVHIDSGQHLMKTLRRVIGLTNPRSFKSPRKGRRHRKTYGSEWKCITPTANRQQPTWPRMREQLVQITSTGKCVP